MKRLKKLSALWVPFTGAEFYVYSACASFYLLLSVLPASVLILTITPYLPISDLIWDAVITQLIPAPLQTLAIHMLLNVFESSSGLIISASVFTTLWSASRGVLSIIDGLNAVNHFPRLRNFVFRQVKAAISFLFLGSSLVLMSVLLIFGDAIVSELFDDFPVFQHIYRFRVLISWLLMTGLFSITYRFLPSRKLPFKNCVFSAGLVSGVWILFSHLFSFYVVYFSSHKQIYGGIGLILLTAIWLRICMLLVLYAGSLAKLISEGQYHPLRIIRSAWNTQNDEL